MLSSLNPITKALIDTVKITDPLSKEQLSGIHSLIKAIPAAAQIRRKEIALKLLKDSKLENRMY